MFYSLQNSFIFSHLCFLSSNEIETITFLRDPIDRIISLYNHFCSDIILYHDFPKQWISFEDFIYDPKGISISSNQLLKLFCLDLYFEQALVSDIRYDKDDPSHFNISSFTNIDIPIDKMLSLARERLNLCDFIGLTEHFDESFDLMCMQYGWLSQKNKPQKNISTQFVQRSNLTTKIIDDITEMNEQDCILYAEALKIFKDRNKVYVYYDRAKIINKISKSISAQESIKYTFEDKIIGEGWDSREGKSPHIFCWNTETVSTLFFSIKAQSDLYISFLILHSLLQNFGETLSLTANQYPISLSSSAHPEEGIIFEGIIPYHAIRKDNNLLELAFSIPNLIRPIDINQNSQDKRKLGFACKTVEIKPI